MKTKIKNIQFNVIVNNILESLENVKKEDEQYSELQHILNAWMDEDQKYTNPAKRNEWQKNTIQPFLKKNIKKILEDNEDRGNYPHSPYAAWLLVQHMDGFVDFQEWFLSELKKAIPDFIKLKFLEDRVAVNKIIISIWEKNPKMYKDVSGKNLTNPTIDVRDENKFPSLKNAETPKSAKEAYMQMVRANNNPLFIKALKLSYENGVTTQPSFQG